MDVIPGGVSALAIQDQGRLFVAPAYYQVTGDAAVQLNAATDWIASKIIPECDFELTDIAWYVTAVGTQGVMAIELYSHDATNNEPDTSLAVLVAESDCGASADAWIQEELSTAQQLYAGKTYWIVGKGTAGDDYSCSTRRRNTAQGSMFPDNMPETKTTDDSGSTWTAATQDSKPALWNIILNPNADGVPQLAFGRASGKYARVTTGLIQIPEEATFLDVSGYTADTLYYVYMDTDGSIEVSTTTWSVSNGMRVKSDETMKRLIGVTGFKDILGGGDQAPADCLDRRLVLGNGEKKIFGKWCPYSGDTSDSGVDTSWEKLNGNSTDYDMDLVVPPGGGIVDLKFAVYTIQLYAQMGVMVDGELLLGGDNITKIFQSPSGTTHCSVIDKIDEGLHLVYPVQQKGSSDAGAEEVYYYVSGASGTNLTSVFGYIET